MGNAGALAVGLILGLSFATSGCVATSSDADCQFVPVSGLAKQGESKRRPFSGLWSGPCRAVPARRLHVINPPRGAARHYLLSLPESA